MISKKTKHIAPKEIRAIRISQQALLEIIYEFVSENENELFDLLPKSDTIVHMAISEDFDDAILYAMDYSQPKAVNFAAIDDFVRSSLDSVTTNSLYEAGTKYIVIKMNGQ